LLGFAIEDTFHYEAYFTFLNKQCGLREARVIISSLFERALSRHVYVASATHVWAESRARKITLITLALEAVDGNNTVRSEGFLHVA
jgi:hypothetical protein